MKNYNTLLFFLLLHLSAFSQNEHKYVKLFEEKKGKRVILYAKNIDSISYDVFLKVETQDYRRSSNRPIIKTIAANSSIKLLTLIKLKDKTGQYSSTFIVNEVAYALKISKDHELLDFKLDRALKEKKVILFTKNKCAICPNAKHILETNKITYTEYNIDRDSSGYLKIIKAFKTGEKTRFKNRIPLLKVGNKVYNSIKTTEDFVGALREAFK